MPRSYVTESATRSRDQKRSVRILCTVHIMASGLVRGCLSSVLTDSTFSGRSQRQIKCLLSEGNNIDTYDEFAQKLMDVLERVYASASSTCTGKITLKERLWRQFHAVRLTKL